MADKTEETKAPSESPKTEETANKEKALEKSVEDLTGGKFDSPEKLAKAYKELESKLGEQSNEVKEVREYMSVAQPVFDVIKNDPELFKTIDQKLRGGLDSKDSDKADADTTTNQEDVRDTTRNMVMASFENKHGINKLSADEQKTLKNAIGVEISELTGTSYKEVDLRRLGSVLEKAYILAKNGIEDKSTLPASGWLG